jgi:integrase
MRIVDPIRDINDVEKIKEYLESENIRNYLLFIIGINTAIKSNLILNLRLIDIVDERLSIRSYIELENKKYYINESIRFAIKKFLQKKNMELDAYLFESQKTNLPINRSHLYKILKNVVMNCDIEMNIGNETLRKTYGYHYYYQTGNIKYLKEIFNKASTKTLFEYLGVEEGKSNRLQFHL